MPTPNGRITFIGNPWPKGHAIESFQWRARVERGTGLWFDLHLTTASYYAGEPKGASDEEPENLSNWKSRVLWHNYHRCTMSSMFWSGESRGFLAATRSSPLDLARVNRSYRVKDTDEYLPAFSVYLLGHDGVTDHRIAFKPQRGGVHSIEWSGKIALEYSGDMKFRYTFKASVSGVKFGGVVFPKDTNIAEAKSIVEPFVTDVYSLRPSRTKHDLRLLPPPRS